jgi:hypothetical protein
VKLEVPNGGQGMELLLGLKWDSNKKKKKEHETLGKHQVDGK